MRNRSKIESFLFWISLYWEWTFPAGIYLFRNNTENFREMYEKCSKLTIKIPEQGHCCRFGVFFVNFEQISDIVLMFPLFTLNEYMPLWLRFTDHWPLMEISIVNTEKTEQISLESFTYVLQRSCRKQCYLFLIKHLP